MIEKTLMLTVMLMLLVPSICEASSRGSRRKNPSVSSPKFMQSFGGYGGYENQTITTQSDDGSSNDPYTTSEIKMSIEYVYRFHGRLFAGPLLRMSNNTSGSGDTKNEENNFEPGVIAQYWFGEPNDEDFVPFVWGGFRYSNSSSGSGEYKSSRSGLTFGGGGGGYLMIAKNIALTTIFEYSMGKHNSKAGEYSSTANYSTMQILIGLSLLK